MVANASLWLIPHSGHEMLGVLLTDRKPRQILLQTSLEHTYPKSLEQRDHKPRD